jgi:hypothetical protein
MGLLLLVIALFPKGAGAQDVVTGRGILCDKAEQVARLIKADDFQATMVAVNAEKANSCAVLPIAFIMHGEKGEQVHVGGDTWQIAQILVLGLMTDNGIRPIEPTVQWSAFHVQERGA